MGFYRCNFRFFCAGVLVFAALLALSSCGREKAHYVRSFNDDHYQFRVMYPNGGHRVHTSVSLDTLPLLEFSGVTPPVDEHDDLRSPMFTVPDSTTGFRLLTVVDTPLRIEHTQWLTFDTAFRFWSVSIEAPGGPVNITNTDQPWIHVIM